LPARVTPTLVTPLRELVKPTHRLAVDGRRVGVRRLLLTDGARRQVVRLTAAAAAEGGSWQVTRGRTEPLRTPAAD